jgi:hypothetical protein
MEIKEYQRFGMIKKYFFGSGSVLYTDPGRCLDREGEKTEKTNALAGKRVAYTGFFF